MDRQMEAIAISPTLFKKSMGIKLKNHKKVLKSLKTLYNLIQTE